MGPSSHLVWEESHMYFGDWKDDRYYDLNVPIGDLAKRNASVYAHIYLTYGGSSYDPQAPNYHPDSVMQITKPLLRFRPKKREVKLKKLIGDKNEVLMIQVEEVDVPEPEETNEPSAWVPYYWPNMTIAIVPTDVKLPVNQPPGVMRHLRLASIDDDLHLPFFVVNDFWMLQENLILVNETVTTLNFSCRFHQLPLWQFQLYQQFDESFKMQETMMGVSEGETDQVKRMLLETNPWLLGITVFVSVLHSVFDFLAFKNDIEFWRKKKDFEGLSFRSTMLNIFFQVVIFLYLVDNDTSWMILISNGIGLLIEAWKINKVVVVKRKDAFPYVEFEDRVKPSKKISKTRKYDEMAFKYLSYALYPLLIGYSVYSLMYQEHKGWYSYILNTLVGFVYAFGFITMTPQLFINYKLKSVAHMPWKTFMYKALNTFIDDLFAFVIKMPTLHRLATLRDDVIFIIYLYQRWIYPEDHKRRNEFGQVGEGAEDDDEDEDDVAEKKDDGAQEPKAVEGASTSIEKTQTSAVQRKKE
ncbi:cleft lip and palate transmembrane protein 1-domain-containing protein [Cladochytrium replicatum]|nr:cleft lip and palate transmembrane protein 1-domain-containing protein [Cladochytrium replicatum]